MFFISVTTHSTILIASHLIYSLTKIFETTNRSKQWKLSLENSRSYYVYMFLSSLSVYHLFICMGDHGGGKNIR